MLSTVLQGQPGIFFYFLRDSRQKDQGRGTYAFDSHDRGINLRGCFAAGEITLPGRRGEVESFVQPHGAAMGDKIPLRGWKAGPFL